MIRLFAILFFVITSFAILLGNFWFTYGIWPKSWVAFTLFLILSLVNSALFDVVKRRE